MGFVCADSSLNAVHILVTWSHYIYKALTYENILPKETNPFIHSCQGCGYILLCALSQRYHYKLSTDQTIYLIQPVQIQEESYDDYVLRVMFYFDYSVWLQNGVNNLNETLIQDMFITNMHNSKIIYQCV